eukprot:3845444-Rhodomonas_salina.1
MLLLNCAAVSWQSTRQQVTALSITIEKARKRPLLRGPKGSTGVWAIGKLSLLFVSTQSG